MDGSQWHWRINGVYVAGHCEYVVGQFDNFNFEAMQCRENRSKAVADPVNCGCAEVCCLIVGAEVIREQGWKCWCRSRHRDHQLKFVCRVIGECNTGCHRWWVVTEDVVCGSGVVENPELCVRVRFIIPGLLKCHW